jgi:CheY-like chemotaxis protein
LECALLLSVPRVENADGDNMNGILRAFEALVFDRRPENSTDEDESENPQAEKPPTRTILVIDDDPIILDTMRGLLRAEGFNVLTSSNGPKGLDMLRYAPRDIRIVLLDYNMPRFNGAETLQFLRKLNPEVKIIAVTGVDINELPSSFREGVDHFFQKPFRSAELIQTIRTLLNGAPTEVAKS